MKISIIVPIYNSEKFLKRCLSSIVNQTYANLEIILINDGSTDNSLNICESFAERDNRIIVVDKKNAGVSTARNAGLEIATGDFLGFVDSDDYISKDMYEKLMQAIIVHDADIAECGVFYMSEEDNLVEKKGRAFGVIRGETECVNGLLKSNNTNYSNCSKLYRRDRINNLSFVKIKHGEDFLFNIFAFSCCNVKVTIEDSCYYYVNNSTSATNQGFSDVRLDLLKATIMAYEFCQDSFPKLQVHAALVILNTVRGLYQIMIKTGVNKKKYSKILKETFDIYYTKHHSEILKADIYCKTKIALRFFYMSPKLYYFIEKMRGK